MGSDSINSGGFSTNRPGKTISRCSVCVHVCVHACTCARVSEFPDTMCVHVPTRVGRGCQSLELELDVVVRFCGGGQGGEGAGSQT